MQGDGDPAAAYEDTHVHAVYDAIAPHFSATRHKPWPRVVSFLQDQPPGAVGLDVGCGNGKYQGVNPHVHLLGSDRSEALIRLARRRDALSGPNDAGSGSGSGLGLGSGSAATAPAEAQGRSDSIHHAPPPLAKPAEVLVADGMALPHRPGSADFVISIAVIHHLSTQERRRASIAALLECAKPASPVLVFVWALEQASSRRGFHEGCEQDTLVSWVMKGPKGHPGAGTTYQRYYHLYKEGELEDDVRAVGGKVLDGGYERDNWWVICSRDPIKGPSKP